MSLTSIARKVVPAVIRRPLRRLVYGWLSPEKQRGKGYVQLGAFLNEAQWWDAERIQAWQLQKLKATVRHAYEQVPGYRALYSEAGVTPDDIVTLTDIRRLPVVDKDMLRDNLEDFCARDVPSWRRWEVQTSGSSGVPFQFYHADSSDWIEDAFIHSGWARGGWRLGDMVALMTTQYLGTKDHFWDYDRARQWVRLSVYQLDTSSVHAYLEKAIEFHAQHLYGGASTLIALANHVIDAGLVGVFRPRSILLGSEVIEDWHKERLREAFPGAKILGWYGHSERAILAPWCESSDSYHVWPFYGYAELLDGEGGDVVQGKTGELVGTSFWSQAVPFIRYRTMDGAKRGADICPACGRYGMILDRIDGRVRDMLITSKGQEAPLPPNIHDDILRNVEQMQYYQDTPGKVIMRLIVRSGYSNADAARIDEVVSAYLGEDMELALQTVDEIPRTEGGKHRVLDQRIRR